MSSPAQPIIFLDDDTDDHFLFADICKNLKVGRKLIFFKTGEAFLDYLKNTDDQPFLILCDINMPKLNGLAVRESVNADPALKEKSIPFIFFSTAATRDQIKAAYQLTVQGFFLKAQTFAETENTLKIILEYWNTCKHPNSLK